MNNKKYKLILYFIVLVILSTIGIQFFWNYKNYQSSKQQLINDVQLSLDNAIDHYYATLAEENTIDFAFSTGLTFPDFNKSKSYRKTLKKSDHLHTPYDSIDSLSFSGIKDFSFIENQLTDSIFKKIKAPKVFYYKTKDTFHNKPTKADSIGDFEFLTSKVIISLINETPSIKDVDSLFSIELYRKNIDIQHTLSYDKRSNPDKNLLHTISKSTFLPKDSTLHVYFDNDVKTIFKRIFSGILISTLLVLAVISCLFYLLNIIKRQKELAIVKNDLISNITHEFKTPITTISTALEAIRNFEAINDPEKTKKYIGISTIQLNKLSHMVEKLLETATLDSENLLLKKEQTDIVALIEKLSLKHDFLIQNKELTFTTTVEELIINIDPFHFENAISNLIDNAIKYGGNKVHITIKTTNEKALISIADNGTPIPKQQQEKIFEKFYRIPTGNVHDVKGFGIGLYYTKNIIEKHRGSIHINSANEFNIFQVTLPL